jgi:glutathione-regulated potassium-efflux system protein KefB
MDPHDLLAAAVVLLAATALTTALFKRIGLGSVLGLLAAGVLVGPWGLEVTEDVTELRHIAEIGVVFLLFIIGLEMQPEKLWSMRRQVFGLGTLQVLVTGAAIALLELTFGASIEVAILVGLGLALSSTAFVIQMLSERGEFASEHGRGAFSVLLLQDLAIVPLLALVPLLAGAPAEAEEGPPGWLKALEIVALLVAVYAVGRHVLPAILHRLAMHRNREAFAVVAALAVIGAAWAMETVHLSQALGAFMVGMLLSGSAYRHQIEAVVEPFKGFLLGLFFISVGMSIDVGRLWSDGFVVAAQVLAVLAIKAAVLFGLCLAFRYSKPAAARISLMLPQSGEFGFVLFGAAAAAGLLTDAQFGHLILIVSISMAATPLLAKAGDRLAAKLSPQAPAEAPSTEWAAGMDRHVVVAGFGRVGRVVCLMLARAGIPYVAFDRDPRRVDLGRREGLEVHYGDASNVHVLSAAGAGRAAAVVVTVNEVHVAEKVVSTVRSSYPDVPIQARALDLRGRDELLRLGVTWATPDTTEASLLLGQAVLEHLGMPLADAEHLAKDMRHDDYAPVRPSPREAALP